MQFYSPLRYPGGKNKLAKFIALICKENNVNGYYIEPYAGGASVALHLLLEGHVGEIIINDYDKAIYAFWHSVIYNTEKLCRKIKSIEVTVENWRKQKAIQNNKDKERDLFKLGLSTLFLNRTNYSGIINGGVIGGLSQKGQYEIDCRFNKDELINRIKFIAIHKKHIYVKNMDALDLVRKTKKDKNTIFYFDPPYYLKGPSLYMNHYQYGDHKEVSEEIKKIKNAKWIVSYDNTPEIKEMYQECRKKEYAFFHTAYNTRIGKEILFFSKDLLVPSVASPTKI